MDNCKTDTSIRRTLSLVPMSNFSCRLPLKTDTSSSKDDFTLSDLIFDCHRVKFILSKIELHCRCLQLIVRYSIWSNISIWSLISVSFSRILMISITFIRPMVTLRRTLFSVPKSARLKRFYCIRILSPLRKVSCYWLPRT